MTDRIVIFYGSKKDFEELIARETDKNQTTIPFMELIQHYNSQRGTFVGRNLRPACCFTRAALYHNCRWNLSQLRGT